MCCVFQPRKHVRKHTFAGQNTQQTCGLKSYFSIMIQEREVIGSNPGCSIFGLGPSAKSRVPIGHFLEGQKLN